MTNFQDFDEEEARVELVEKFERAKSCDKVAISALESHLILMTEYVEFLKNDGDYSEILYELEDDIARILNDSHFREDRIGPNSANCPELFHLAYKFFQDDPNIEVVLACNPNIPDEITNLLLVSESFWEEDGAQQALARNRREPWILEKLSKSEQDSVRYEVALNESTPPKILDLLISDTASCDWRVEESKFGGVSAYRGYIRWAVIQNPSTEKDTLKRMMNNELLPLDEEIDEILRKVALEFLNE
jgi:hypothetical protein